MTGYTRGGYDRGDFGFCRAKPLEVGREHDVAISARIERGNGIARIKGFVNFVAGAKAGEHLKTKVIEVGNRFGKAQGVARSSERKPDKEG